MLASEAQLLADPPLGLGEVEQRTFVGAYERLRLRLPPIPGVRPIAPAPLFGSDCVFIEVMRTQEQARRFPLQPGDEAWIGVRRAHALAHPGLSLLLVTDGSPAGQAAVAFGGKVVQMAHAHGMVLGVGLTQPQIELRMQEIKQQITNLPAMEAQAIPGGQAAGIAGAMERFPYDLVALTRGPGDATDMVQRLLDAGQRHVLLTPRRGAPIPASALICVAGTEPSKEDVLFAGRLCRHLHAAVTLLTVRTDDMAEASDIEHSQRFLDAAARSLALLEIRARTLVRSEPLVEAITSEMASGRYGLLVLGAPLRPMSSARIRPFVTNEPDYPVLIVRSAYATQLTLSPSAVGSADLGEEIVS
jgi:sulfate transport system ATP-binding protein